MLAKEEAMRSEVAASQRTACHRLYAVCYTRLADNIDDLKRCRATAKGDCHRNINAYETCGCSSSTTSWARR